MAFILFLSYFKLKVLPPTSNTPRSHFSLVSGLQLDLVQCKSQQVEGAVVVIFVDHPYLADPMNSKLAAVAATSSAAHAVPRSWDWNGTL